MTEPQVMALEHDGTALAGRIALPQGDGQSRAPFPAVLVMHNALGLRHQVGETARKLAERGYLAVATDMYGSAVYAEDGGGPEQAFLAFMQNPAAIRERAVAWFEAVAARPDVDPARVAAIGYCFGGHCVLELARSGADARFVASYHGLLTTHAPAAAGAVRAHVAAFCGMKDPYAPPEHITALSEELTAAGASFQIDTFSEAEHAFTDPDAARLGRPGIAYDAVADAVSWAATLALLDTLMAV